LNFDKTAIIQSVIPSVARNLLFLLLVAPFLLIGNPVRADYAILENGFRLQIERMETSGSSTRLFLGGGGSVEMLSSRILDYEKEERPPAAVEPKASSADLTRIITAAGAQHGVDAALVKSVIAAESNFNSRAVSPKGAAGLMQLMPGTAKSVGVQDSLNAGQNVIGGTKYLRALLERYKGDMAKALAAYNAGPGAVDRYNGIPPYTETQRYVRQVITRFNSEKTKH
jgi:hypothetical protein